MDSYISEAQDLFDFTRELRREIHRHPELGFEEVRTAELIEKELNEIGLEVRTGIAETGVVAVLNGEDSGPVVLARFDMDALQMIRLRRLARGEQVNLESLLWELYPAGQSGKTDEADQLANRRLATSYSASDFATY